MELTLSPDALPFVLDGRPVLFSERTQKLYELNGAAAALAARLLAGPVPMHELVSEAAAALPDAEGVAHLLLSWAQKGLLQASLPGAYGRGKSLVRRLAAGPLEFELAFADDGFARALALPYGHLPSGGDGRGLRVETVLAGGFALVMAEGRGSLIVQPGAAGLAIRQAILEAILDQDACIAIHAACLVIDGEAILLCGSPGAGKSTLAAVLGRSGFGLAGDDIAMFDPIGGMVMGVGLPLTLKRGSWSSFVGNWPELADNPPVERGDGEWVSYIRLPSAVPAQWLPLRAIICLERSSGETPALLPLGKIDCLRRLYGEAHSRSGRSSADALRALASLVDGAEILRLCYGEAGEAARALEARFAS